MFDIIKINQNRRILLINILLTLVVFAVFWQVVRCDFIIFDDDVYVTENIHVQSGITLEGLRWVFSTTYAEFWHPLTWLSLMFDYELYGLHAAGYHMTNLILHIMSTLLLFWLFNRMTGDIWQSAFVAAFFALHPLRVESVAWIAERKDVLSVFFWMLTLVLYVYYTERPVVSRYLPVLACFVCGLMSKPMVVTLPMVMILLDYWPLGRFKSPRGHLIVWQLKEKGLFFILSAVFSIITWFGSRPMLLASRLMPSTIWLPVGSFSTPKVIDKSRGKAPVAITSIKATLARNLPSTWPSTFTLSIVFGPTAPDDVEAVTMAWPVGTFRIETSPLRV